MGRKAGAEGGGRDPWYRRFMDAVLGMVRGWRGGKRDIKAHRRELLARVDLGRPKPTGCRARRRAKAGGYYTPQQWAERRARRKMAKASRRANR